MNKMIFGLTLIVLLLPFVMAATDTTDVDDIFKINSAVEYAKPCFNNGTYCSGSATCNYSVFNPDNTILVNNQLGTNQGAYYNISFTPTNIGVYKVDMTCVDGSLNGAETLYFEVTGSGFNNTALFYILLFLIPAGIMILGFYLNDAPMVILGSFALTFTGLYILFNGIVGIKDMTTTWAIGIIVLMLAGYIGIKSSWEIIGDN